MAIVTCEAMASLHADDRLLLEALRRQGLDARPAIWSDPALPWREVGMAVVRNTWDYVQNLHRFRTWLSSAAAATRLLNPVDAILWNLDKKYLLELAARGVPIVPTFVLPAGLELEALAKIAEAGVQELVLKPSVDAGAKGATRTSLPKLEAAIRTRPPRNPGVDLLVQPFLPSVQSRGELSIVFVDGAYSHSVRKRPRIGDYRVQDDWGGVAELDEPTAEELSVARQVLAAADAILADRAGGTDGSSRRRVSPLLFARVDLLDDAVGHPVLGELEIIEPQLFLLEAPEAAKALASAIRGRWSEGRSSGPGSELGP